MLRVLVALDGSNHSARVMKEVVRLQGDIKGGLDAVLLNVQSPLPVRELLLEGRPSEITRLEQPLRERGRAMLAPFLAELRAGGAEVRAEVEVGDPGPVIVRIAEKFHCELIVMGTRGLGAVAALFMGSVTTKVLHLAHVPVLLVP